MHSDKMDVSFERQQPREREAGRWKRGGGNSGQRSAPYSNQNHRRLNPDEPWRHDKYDGPDVDLRAKIGQSSPPGGAGGRRAANNSNSRIADRLGPATTSNHARAYVRPSVSVGRAAASVETTSSARAPPTPSETEGFTVRVRNLDPNASAADVQATFSDLGAIIKSSVSYDAATVTNTAEIVFKEKKSVLVAIDTYDGVIADGRTLKIEEVAPRGVQIIGRSAITPVTATQQVPVSVLKTANGAVVVGGMYSDRVGASSNSNGAQFDSQSSTARKVPITERLGGRSR
ncbi:hypothetical protein BJ741DRAFT_663289 [Chytriomyces cf. hyalinus JEL632]|nr:hypothetical protein BJ741DRAFT_663289 [Chytriomyces cf. hyalinus JEL632]